MKKYGCLTWWRNNYGSILQALALQEVILNSGLVEYEIICQYGKKSNSITNFYDKLKRFGLATTIRRLFWKFFVPQIRGRSNAIQKFVDDRLIVSSTEYSENSITKANESYDGFICGSDQVWNLDLVSENSMYWLAFADSNKTKIAYAPSIGVEIIEDEQIKILEHNLKSFKAISCREKNGTDLINSILGDNSCVNVLDPTMLIEREFWDNLSFKRIIEEPYIFVYMLRGTKKQRRVIERYAKHRHINIVTIPFLDTEKIVLYDCLFGDIKCWKVNPADFISLIRNAECVFTDSFHSTVFSCLYHKDFYIFPKIGNSQSSRLINIQEMFNISSRIIDESFTNVQIDNIEKIDWEKVDDILVYNRNKSREYLFNALAEE